MKNKLVKRSYRIYEDQEKRLKQIARKLKISQSAVVRIAIMNFNELAFEKLSTKK